MSRQQFQIIPDIHSNNGVVRMKCERDKRVHDYDFNFIRNDEWRERLIECFVSKKTELKVHASRRLFVTHIKKFFESLTGSRFSSPLSGLNHSVLDGFFIYLHSGSLSMSQKSKYCSTALRALRRINALHDDSYFSIDIPQNPFVGTTETVERSTSYSAEEFDQIIAALGNSLEDNSIIAFDDKWFDKSQYIVGDFSKLEFRECFYVNYYRTGKTVEGLDLSEAEDKVRCNFFKWNSQCHGSSKAFYDHMEKDIESYKHLYSRKKLAFVRIGAPEVFQLFMFTAIASGFNKQVLLDMERGKWLAPHPFMSGVSIIQAPKFRSKRIIKSSFAEDNDAVIRVLKKYERICDLLIDKKHDFRKLWRIGYYSPAELLPTTVDKQNRDFVRSYGLEKVIGTSSIHFRKIRATAAEQMLVRFKGDFTKLKQFLNHAKAETTYDYVEQCLDNKHIQEELSEKVDMMTCAFMGLNGDSNKEQLKSHLDIDDDTAGSLMDGSFDTPYARCKNPYSGDSGDFKKGKICDNFDLLRCFICNNIVIFPDDLYKLFSYVNLKKKQLQSGLISDEIYSLYAPLIEFIECTLPSRFEDLDVQAMKEKAKTDPYYVYS